MEKITAIIKYVKDKICQSREKNESKTNKYYRNFAKNDDNSSMKPINMKRRSYPPDTNHKVFRTHTIPT